MNIHTDSIKSFARCIHPVYFISLILLLLGCREKYNPSIASPETGYLVVEGFINASGPTTFNLSRTNPLSEKGLREEKNAIVRVQGNDNSSYELFEKEDGKYVSDTQLLQHNIQYRLFIKTEQGKEYASDYSQVIQQPPLDSLTWERHFGGVEIFAHAKGSDSDTKYYKWDYEETWEYKSDYAPRIKLVPRPVTGNERPYLDIVFYDPVLNTPDSSNYICWQSRKASPSIIIGNTLKLSENTLYFPVRFHPEAAWELSDLYFIKVKQVGISKEAYEFYEKLKKNTESLGSVFDRQPSEVMGNIKCLTVPSEPVIGFVDASTQMEKSIFISNKDLPNWNYRNGCGLSVVAELPQDSLYKKVIWEFRLAVMPNETPPGVVAASAECVDCRIRGGINVKPSFWP